MAVNLQELLVNPQQWALTETGINFGYHMNYRRFKPGDKSNQWSYTKLQVIICSFLCNTARRIEQRF
jgi:hypothetical protein